MKKLILSISIVILSTLTQFSMAQESSYLKQIQVEGSAEKEVVPDEIYIAITLKEYFKEKENKTKVNIASLEKQLKKAVEEAGITKENFMISEISGGLQWWGKRKPEIFCESKEYMLKVEDLSKIDGILLKVDEKGKAYVRIEKTAYSKMPELRKEIKIKALQAAKAKAKYLLEAVDEQLGEVLNITEIESNNYYHARSAFSNVAISSDAAPESSSESTIGIEKIKVKYEMKVVFRIK